MLGLERERLGEVGVEVGGALAGDPVDEVERDVVESGITENVHRAADVVGPARRSSTCRRRGWKRLRAERHAIDTVS